MIAGSRLIPLIRSVFPYAAGIAKLEYPRFIVPAAIGSVVWISGLAFLGKAVGSDWTSWRHYLEYVDYAALIAFIGVVVYFVVKRRRERQAQTIV